jgi:hypothetical protein
LPQLSRPSHSMVQRLCEIVLRRLPSQQRHTQAAHLQPVTEHLLASASSTSALPPPVMCWRHPDQPIKVYCGSCKAAVCLKCAVTHHNGHPVTELEPAHKQQLPILKALVGDVQAGASATASAIAELRTAKGAAVDAVKAAFRSSTIESTRSGYWKAPPRMERRWLHACWSTARQQRCWCCNYGWWVGWVMRLPGTAAGTHAH